MGIKMSPGNFPVVCDGYEKYEEVEVDRLAIMQNQRNNTIFFKWLPVSNFVFYFCENCHVLSLCDSVHFVLYTCLSYFAFCSS